MPIISGNPKQKDCLKANKTLVHCADCVHYKKIIQSDLCFHCRLMLQTDGVEFANRRVPPDGYCWRGELRKDVEVNTDADF